MTSLDTEEARHDEVVGRNGSRPIRLDDGYPQRSVQPPPRRRSWRRVLLRIARVDEAGNFHLDITLKSGVNDIVAAATDDSGVAKIVSHRVTLNDFFTPEVH